MGKKDEYEHTLKLTRCDYCAKETEEPFFFKFEESWIIFFFCTKEHQYAFGKRSHEGYTTLQ